MKSVANSLYCEGKLWTSIFYDITIFKHNSTAINFISHHFLAFASEPLLICPFFFSQGVHRVRALVPAGRPALCAPAVPTAPARPWSACGVEVRSDASTPRRTSSPSPTASVWSGRLRTALVRERKWNGSEFYMSDCSWVGFRSVCICLFYFVLV